LNEARAEVVEFPYLSIGDISTLTVKHLLVGINAASVRTTMGSDQFGPGSSQPPRSDRADYLQSAVGRYLRPVSDRMPARHGEEHGSLRLGSARSIATVLAKAECQKISFIVPSIRASKERCRSSYAPAERNPSARITMLGMNDDPIFAARAIEAGAKGYVSKSGELLRPLRDDPSGRKRGLTCQTQ
jgi:hypothetical protein